MTGRPDRDDPPNAAVTIFHNPRCSKSRQALALLEERGVPHAVVDYQKTPPDRATLESILARLEEPPAALVRAGDAAFTELGLDETSLSSPNAVVDLLTRHPELMQRPVLTRGDRAVIGRPTERVGELLE